MPHKNNLLPEAAQHIIQQYLLNYNINKLNKKCNNLHINGYV